MIRYALRCADGHDFESWFQSGDAFDALRRGGHLSCAICGGAGVEKALMAPKVPRKGDAPPAAPPVPSGPPEAADSAPALPGRPLSKPAHPMEKALAALRAKVEANSTYVGGGFAKEARAQHLGEVPERSIYGEATPKEAKALVEEGVPIAPLPFRPKSKSN